MIETYIIEEHHEAFLVWNLAKEHGIIPPKGNVLLHIDEHSDLGTPRCKRSILDLKTLEDIKSFTYTNLKIGNFIVPTVYQGLIDSIYWIKQKHREIKSYQRYVRSVNTEGKKFVVMQTLPEGINLTNDDVRVFQVYKQEIANLDCPKEVILDIDLDYFSSQDPTESIDVFIEITEKEYNQFVQDRYHQLNFFGSYVEAIKHNGQYFYAFNNYEEIYSSRFKPSDNIVVKRINNFIEGLERMAIQPSLITICRSALSGYTPSDQCEFIQKCLIAGLHSLYDLNIQQINELFNDELVTSF